MNNQTNRSIPKTGDINGVSPPLWSESALTIIFIILAPTLAILLQIFTARISNSNSNSNSNTDNTSNKTKSNHFQSTHNQGRRQIQHALTGFLFFILSYLLPYSIACSLLSLATIVFYILHLLRSASTSIQQQYMKHFGPLLRDHERNVHTVPGAFWFLLGTTILVIFFRMDVVRTSLLCLSFGDPMASIAGMNVKHGPKMHLQHGIKSLVGSCSCFWTCLIVSMVCMGIEYGPGVWFVTAFVATLMEGLSGFVGIDDNILIPLGTGTALSIYLESNYGLKK